MKKTLLPLILVMLVMTSNSFTQTISGEIRQRGELRYGYKTPADSTTEAAGFISQRTRMGIALSLKNVEMKITLQDVRIWGNQKLKSILPTTGIYEAWAMLPLSDSLSLKIGRQELIYDNERLLSNNNWNQGAQVHDAAVLKFKNHGWKADFAAAFNSQEERFSGNDYSASFKDSLLAGNYKHLAFLNINKQLTDKFNINLMSISEGFQKQGTHNTFYHRNTSGGAITFSTAHNKSITARTYIQSGKTSSGVNINAWYLNTDIKTIFKEKITLNPGVEIFSGKDGRDLSDKTFRSFSTLYGTGHNFNGHMDYFTDIPKHTKNSGLVNLYLKTNYKLNNKISIKADYHYFALQNAYLFNEKSGTSVYDKTYLGSEMDINCNINFSKEVCLLFGYSLFMSEEPLNHILGGEAGKLSHWGFVMLTVKPDFSLNK